MKDSIVFRSFSVALSFVFSLFLAGDGLACSCSPYANQSLCQLGDEANSQGGRANFMAVIELGDSTMSGEYINYTVTVLELLAGDLPSEEVVLTQFGLGWSCAQIEFIEPGAKGVLIGRLDSGVAMPDFCKLQNSFFRMVADTVFVPLYLPNSSPGGEPYTLTEFRANDCENFTNSSKEVTSADDAFSLSYDWQNEQLVVAIIDQSLRSEKLALSIYSSSGQHLLEANPIGPIDMSAMPPGMYAILIRDEQQAWSKAFVKPN